MPQINIRWADNTAELRQHLREGLNQIEATKASVEKLVTALGGQGLFQAAHRATAAINELGGATKLTAAEQQRHLAILEKAIEKYRVMGQTAPTSIKNLADELRKLNAPTLKFTELTGLATKALGAFGIGLSVGAVVNFGKAILADADNLTKLHDKTGLSIESLQIFRRAADDAGNTLDQLTTATNQMQNRLAGGDQSAVAALDKLGLSLAELRRLSPEQQFMAIANALRDVRDPADQVNIAMDLFGRQGAEILPTIKRGFDDIADSAGNMSAETVKALEEANDAMERWERNAKNIFARVIGGAIKNIEEKGTGLFSKQEEFRQKLSKGIIEQFSPLTLATLNAPQPVIPTVTPLGIPAEESIIVRKLNSEVEAIKAKTDAQKKAAAEQEAAMKKEIENWKVYDDHMKDALRSAMKWIEATGKGQPTFLKDWMKRSAINQQTMGLQLLDSRDLMGAISTRPMIPGGVMGEWQKQMTQQLRPTLTAGFGDLFKTSLPQALLASFQGGGSPIKAAGGLLGAKLGENVVSKFGTAITNKLGGVIGGGVNAILPGVGALIGPGISALVGGIKKLFGGPSEQELKGRAESAAFQDAIAKTLTVQQKLEAGGQSWKMTVIGVRDAYLATGRTAAEAEQAVLRLWDTKNPEAYKRAMEEIQGVFDEQKQDQADLQAAIQRYGFTLEQLGPTLQRQKLGDQARQLLNDFRLLAGAGIDFNVVLDKMGSSINEFIQSAIRTGTEVPAAMRPILEHMIGQKELLDENGQAFESLEDTGLTFAETMTQGFDRVVNALNKLLVGLGLVPEAVNAIPTNRTIDVDVNYNDPGFTPETFAGAPFGRSDEVFASQGGLVTVMGVQRFQTGGLVKPPVRQYLDVGGLAVMDTLFPSRGTDTVLARLTPGEVVLNQAQQANVAAGLAGRNDNAIIKELIRIEEAVRSDRYTSVEVDGRELVKASTRAIDNGGALRTDLREAIGVD
jgi:hypothetical protein